MRGTIQKKDKQYYAVVHGRPAMCPWIIPLARAAGGTGRGGGCW
ncbi:MAG TPA: hypothetical protein VFI46_13650 [Jiangellaceae bacterium]|nr:hypothetical protein [Jiangellaceae bacterium]